MIVVKLSLTLIFLLKFQSTVAGKYEDCKTAVVPNSFSKYFFMSDFKCNLPKFNEVLRTKAYFKGGFPSFRITNDENSIYFGKIILSIKIVLKFCFYLGQLRKTEFAIFNITNKYLKPQDSVKFQFPEDKFTEVDIIMTSKYLRL